MARVHLFEFEDQKWFPTFLRNYGTDFLQFLANKSGMYKPVVAIIEKALHKSNTNHIVDLGSGGGGGLIWLAKALEANNPSLTITLTDYFPNIDAFEQTQRSSPKFKFVKEPVDARNVPAHLKGLRTQFLSLHHFQPEDARLILQNAVDSGNSIAIFEGQERSTPSLLAMLFSPLTVLFTTPFIKPFKVGRIFFTYLLPVVPAFVLWDGIVSSLRTYSVNEMQELVSSVRNAGSYEWEIGKVKSGPGAILYLVGTKKQ